MVIHILVAGTTFVVGFRPGWGGTVAAHVLFGIEEVGTTAAAAADVVCVAAPMLLNDAVDAGGIPGGRGGWRPAPP